MSEAMAAEGGGGAMTEAAASASGSGAMRDATPAAVRGEAMSESMSEAMATEGGGGAITEGAASAGEGGAMRDATRAEGARSGRRVAVVTGGSRGIGFEVARQLAARGLHVVLTAREAARAEAAARRVRDEGGAASGVAVDVTRDESVAALAEHVRAAFGRADVLVNNAGVALDKWVPAVDARADVVRETMETNFYGALRCTLALLPLMREGRYGRVVNVSSQLGSLERMSGATLGYRVSKASLNVLTRLFAGELKDENVIVNSACPGWVRTALGGDDAPRTPEEGARVIVHLATLPDDGPRGGFFQEGCVVPW